MGNNYLLITCYVCIVVLQLCNSQVLYELGSIHVKIDSMERKMLSLETTERNNRLTISQLQSTLAQQQAAMTKLHKTNLLQGDEISDLMNRAYDHSTTISNFRKKLRTQELIIKQQSRSIASIRKFQNSFRLKNCMHSEDTLKRTKVPLIGVRSMGTKNKHVEQGHETKRKQKTESQNQATTLSRTMEKRSLSPVAFMAVLTTTRSNLGVDQGIIFNTAPLNEGGVYSILHGIFTAPQAGIYIFSTTLVTRSHHGVINHTNAAIVRNGHHVTVLCAPVDSGTYGECSQTVIVQLNQGDDVWVSNTKHTDNEVYGDSHSTFSGALLAS